MVCDLPSSTSVKSGDSLNPCFNGIWSATVENTLIVYLWEVLILVLMEYGLRHPGHFRIIAQEGCLNPCFNGIWSATLAQMVGPKRV